MPLQKKKRMQLIKQCLQNYEEREIARIEEKTQAVELSVSLQFQKKIEEMLKNVPCDRKEHVPTRWFHTAVFRYAAVAIIAVLIIAIPYETRVTPQGIVAGIPNFILEQGENIFDTINLKVNPYAVYKNELDKELPELEFGYIPDGFEVVEEDDRDKEKQRVISFTDETGAFVQVSVKKKLGEDRITTVSKMNMGKLQWSYIGEKEVLKISRSEMNKMALCHVWIYNDYIITFYSEGVEANCMEKIIGETSLTQ